MERVNPLIVIIAIMWPLLGLIWLMFDIYVIRSLHADPVSTALCVVLWPLSAIVKLILVVKRWTS